MTRAQPVVAWAEWPLQARFVRSRLLTAVPVAAAAVAAVTELTLMLIKGDSVLGYIAALLSAAGVAGLLWRRWIGIALVTAGAVLAGLFANEFVGLWTVVVFAMFVFALRDRWALLCGLVAGLAIYVALVLRDRGDLSAPVALVAGVMCLTGAAIGAAVRLQREAWDAARQRAADAERARAVELQRALTDERLRIARDLHDAVGHEIAVASINVGAAEVAIPRSADDAIAALGAAREALQRTLTEMQQILDLLRSEGMPAGEYTELASAEHVPALVQRFVSAGASIDATIDAVPSGLEPDVSAAAYRIVQEALTNGQRHGRGTISVSVTVDAEHLVIEVSNDVDDHAMANTSGRTGHGLVGMRERAESAGGSIRLVSDDETFQVHARLPIRRRSIP